MFTASDVLTALTRHIGQGNGARADTLVAEITGKPGPDRANERHLRQLITGLRMEGHHICAHPNHGYFIAANDGELDATARFLFERALSSLKQIAAMKRVSLPDLAGQLRIDL